MTAPDAGWQVAAGDEQTIARASLAASRQRGPGGISPSRGERAATPSRPDSAAPAPGPVAGPAVSVLADRLAAALVHHEPGWRLPRHSALARRYNVSAAEIDAAVGELIGRHLVRRLADGQIYRASPAEYLIGLEGIASLGSDVDAMGSELSCRSRQVSWRSPPEDISWALQLGADQHVCVLRLLWTADGEPAAVCTTYLRPDLARRAEIGDEVGLPTALNVLRLTDLGDGSGGAADTLGAGGTGLAGLPAELHIELQAPPPSVARSLRLTAGQPATIMTVRFDEPERARPVALTIAVLRPEMFRVIVQSPQSPLPPDGSAADWLSAEDDDET